MTKIRLVLIPFIFAGLTMVNAKAAPVPPRSAAEFKPVSSSYLPGSGLLENFSRDGKIFLSSNNSLSTVTLWDTGTLEPISSFFLDQGAVTSARFSPDGRYILTLQNICGHRPGVHFCQSTSALTVWDASSGKELSTMDLGEGTFHSIVYSQNGQRLLLLAPNQFLIYDAKSFKPLLTQGRGSWNFSKADLSPDGQRVLLTYQDAPNGSKPATLLDLKTGQSLALSASNGGTGVILAKFSPDGRTLALVGYGQGQGMLTLLDAKTLMKISEQKGIINSVSYSNDGKSLFVAAESLSKWNLATGALKPIGSHNQIFRANKPIWVHSVLVSPDDKKVLSFGSDGSLIAWKRVKN